MHFSESHPLLIVGGGNMGMALATRWRQWKPIIVEPSALRRAALKDEGFATHESLSEVKHAPRACVVAVKPQTYPEIAAALQKVVGKHLLISIMAGVKLASLPARSVRVMPNTPALIGQAMSVCHASSNLSPEDRQLVSELFAACGEVAWVESEDILHAVTAISGSGPAYVFAFMEALEKAAVELGIHPETAHLLVKQTVLGAAAMAHAGMLDFAQLREQVTSKGGTTEAALEGLMAKLPGILRDAAKAAAERSKSLATH